MPELRYSRLALADLDRLASFLDEHDPVGAATTYALIFEALSILGRHPLIGRLVESSLRELVISRGRTGYVALHSLDLADDAVTIWAIRHQRGVGYQDADIG